VFTIISFYIVCTYYFTSKLAQHISAKLEVGTLVQFGNPVQYGVIKKIETPVAEVETVS